MRSTAVLASLVAAAALAVPATSSAATRFIQPNGTDSGTCLLLPCKTITYAAGKAAAGDTIKLAAGDYAQGATIDKELTIAGAGAGVVGQPADPTKHTIVHRLAGHTLTLRGGGAVNGLRVVAGGGGSGIVLSGAATAGADAYAVDEVVAEAGAGQSAIRVAEASAAAPVEVDLRGGGAVAPDAGILNLTGAIELDGAAVGVHVRDAELRGMLAVGDGHAVVEGTSVASATGALLQDGSLVLRRSAVRTTVVGVLSQSGGGSVDVLVEDSTIDVQASSGSGCGGVALVSAGTGHAELRRSTVRVRCPGQDEVFGVAVLRAGPGAGETRIDLRSTAVSADGVQSQDVGAVGEGTSVTAEHSAFATATGAGGGVVPAPGSGTNVSGPLGLGEDLRPGAGSVLIDHGDPAAAALADFAGAARTADGDSDGTAVPDIGALEAPAGTTPLPVPEQPAPPATGSPLIDPAPWVGGTAPRPAPKLTVGRLRLVGIPRAGRAVKVRAALSAPATVTVELRRGTRTVAKRTVRLAAGTHTIAVPGRRLHTGRCAIRLSAKGSDGRLVRAGLKFRVRAR